MGHELWTASCVLIGVGLFAFVFGSIRRWLLARRNLRSGIETEARVVDIVPVKREPSEPSVFRNRQAAVFEFFAAGQPVKVTDDAGDYPCSYRLHQRVRIRYNPDNPKEYRVTGRDPKRLFAEGLRLVGMLLLLLGCGLFLLYAAG